MSTPVFDAEAWRIVEGFNGRYQVSNHGRVMRLSSDVTLSDDMVLSATLKEAGLTVMMVRPNGHRTTRLVPRLVLMAFRPIVQAHLKRVIYKNDDPSDCRLSNLDWGERFGAAHGRAKLTEDDVRAIRGLWMTSSETHTQIGRRYKVAKSTIGSLLNGESWSHVT